MLHNAAERLLNRLRTQDTATARELAQALNVSQPTVSRLLRRVGDQVIAIGRGRARRYAARRDIRHLGDHWPLYRLDESGTPSRIGTLNALHEDAFLLETDNQPDWLRGEFVNGLFPGLPWFMTDMQPQGYLGRLFAHHTGPDIGLPNDLTRWSNDDIIVSLLRRGADLPGQFILGETALDTALAAKPHIISANNKASAYSQLANAVSAGETVGSSAAGEQPKFTACAADANNRPQHVIVKFSDATHDNPVAWRWADLLVAEHTANSILTAHGITCAETQLIETQDRTMLESHRFDRNGLRGRRGFITLGALDDAHYGRRDNWAAAASRLHHNDWITEESAEKLILCWWFGRLIGNTDMHFGNIGFYLSDSLPLHLAPIYDMVPMHFRPAANGAIPQETYPPATPRPESMNAWEQAYDMALTLWRQLADEQQVSTDFQRIAVAQMNTLLTFRQRLG